MSGVLALVRVARQGYSEMTRPARLGGVTSPVRPSLVVMSEPTHLGEPGHDTCDMTGTQR
jgi:hypothetical protein